VEDERALAEQARAGVESDDAARRYEAMDQLREGPPRPETLVRERDKVGVSGAASVRSYGPFLSAPTPVLGIDWINLGPTTADFETNGATFNQVDGGRLRSIVPHPGDPNILFIATAGGGIWKTYNAGATWEPLTDRLGTLGSGALAMDPRNPDILVYGFGDTFDSDLQMPGVVTSTDGGATWSNDKSPVPLTATIGGFPAVATQVRDLKIDPNNSAVILAATNIGLFRSTDFGAHWTLLTLPGANAWMGWSIAWAGGTNWLVTAQELTVSLANLIQPPRANDSGKLGYFRSTDDGATFTDASASFPAGVGRVTLAVATSTVGDPPTARVYALAANLPGPTAAFATRDVYRSEDGGQTFIALGVNSGARPTNPTFYQRDLDVLHGQAWYNQAILVDPTNPDTVFIGGNLSMIRTTNAGATWSVVADWLPASDGAPLDYLHADYHAMAASLASGSPVYYFGTDGGLFKSEDAATALRPHIKDALNRGVVSHLVYSVGCSHEGWPAELLGFTLGGLQDNGTRVRALPKLFPSPSGPSSFNMVIGGDGVGVAVSRDLNAQNLPKAVLASTPGGDARFPPLYISSDGAVTFTSLNSGISPGLQPFLIPYASDDAPDGDGETFLTVTEPSSSTAADAHVYRITTASASGARWNDITGTVAYPDGSTSGSFHTRSGAPAAPHYVAANSHKAGTYLMDASSGTVFSTTDAGVHWKASNPLGSDPAKGNTTAIKGTSGMAFDWNDTTGQTFYVGSIGETLFDFTNASFATAVPDSFGHLFKTSDGGLSWAPLLGCPASTANAQLCRLPNVPVNAVKVDPANASTIYVGTYLGLYVSTDRGQNFSRMGVGLPLVSVSDICVSGDGSIKVSTYGRGFWAIDQRAASNAGGAHGRGDMDYNQKLDAFDLIDLVAVMGTTNRDNAYRQEADLTGQTAAVDDADLAAFLSKFGGTP
jgi:photosystem II stability/assembly factor-like uncharacterized protein